MTTEIVTVVILCEGDDYGCDDMVMEVIMAVMVW